MQHTFATPEPVELRIDTGPGIIRLHPVETVETVVTLTGKFADKFTVEQNGRVITITTARRWFVGLDFGPHSVEIDVHLPIGSDVATRTGSADLRADGQLGICTVKTGSGDIELASVVSIDAISGSGDISVSRLDRDSAIKTGSGGVSIGTSHGPISLISGSGDLSIDVAHAAITTKTASGDQVIHELGADASIATASGDITLGRMWTGSLRARSASGDVDLSAPSGTPVWTDMNSVAGAVHSSLEAVGQPEPGQAFVQWHVRTASGDITVRHN